MTRVKICGLTRESDVETAIDAGADLVGFVLVHRSPRHVDISTASRLAEVARGRAAVVALMVDPDDALVEAVLADVRPDYLQLHGHEGQGRVSALRGGFDVPVIKALGVASAADLAAMNDYSNLCDLLLIDAKPEAGDTRTGGLGRTFDWDLLKPPRHNHADFLLAGGLTPENVAEAVARVRPWGVDVSSGVESAPGVKDPAKVRAFVQAAKGAG
jgi:phosphoribosylanthranilate isomerase